MMEGMGNGEFPIISKRLKAALSFAFEFADETVTVLSFFTR